MEAISPPLDDFDLVIDPFQPPGMNRILAVIQDSIPVAVQGFSKLSHGRMVHRTGQSTPLRNGFICPCPGSIGPDMFEFIFEDEDHIDDFVQAQEFFQVPPIFKSTDVAPVSQEKIFGAFEDRFVGFRGFPVFAVTHFIDDPRKLGHDMKQVENDLDVRDFRPYGHDIRVPHIHHHGFQRLSLHPAHAREKSPEGSRFAVFADPNHTAGLVIQDHGQIAVAFADRDFVDGQDAKPPVVGLPKLFFQELLIDGFDRFPVQSQMAGDLLDGHDLREPKDIARQPLGHPQIGIEKIQLLDGSLLAVGTDDLPIQAADPDAGRPEIQVADPASLLTVNSICPPSADMANGTEPFVGHSLQVSFPGISGNLLAENTDSGEGEIVCYTQRGHRRPPLDVELER